MCNNNFLQHALTFPFYVNLVTQCNFLSSVVLHCASSFMLLQFCIFDFLKTTRPIFTSFGVKYLYGTRNLNCEILALPPPGPQGRSQICKKDQMLNIFFSSPTRVEKKPLCMAIISMELSTLIVKSMAPGTFRP